MAYGGFEEDRETLKYCCPARPSGSPGPGLWYLRGRGCWPLPEQEPGESLRLF